MVMIKANAKINLTLDILGKRQDGYHEVAMVMQEISLADIINLDKQVSGITLAMDNSDLPADETNLAWKAAKLFLTEAGIKGGVSIRIEKFIPIAAGLAGGSADAAGTLVGLNELFDAGLTVKELCLLGEQIGSDVPFCICGGTMLATGRGEVLKRLPSMPKCYVVLAKPKISVSTAWAYRTYDERGVNVHPDNSAIIDALAKNDLREIASLLGNVLEEVTSSEYKEIVEYKKIMQEAGALASMMSGSGPTVFSLTDNKETAERIASAINNSVDAETVKIVKITDKNRGIMYGNEISSDKT